MVLRTKENFQNIAGNYYYNPSIDFSSYKPYMLLCEFRIPYTMFQTADGTNEMSLQLGITSGESSQSIHPLTSIYSKSETTYSQALVMLPLPVVWQHVYPAIYSEKPIVAKDQEFQVWNIFQISYY